MFFFLNQIRFYATNVNDRPYNPYDGAREQKGLHICLKRFIQRLSLYQIFTL